MSIRFENTEVWGFEHAMRGMRNPMNSWDKSDSEYETFAEFLLKKSNSSSSTVIPEYKIGPNDLVLANKLINAGNEHRKFLRQIFVSVDITAPLYWWKEFDTYKIGTVANSCSTMHKIAAKEFTLEDFSHEHVTTRSLDLLMRTIKYLNECRDLYVNYDTHDNSGYSKPTKKEVWWQMIQLLPSSYNQKRTITLNYENIRCMYFQRKNHKLDEWSIGFMDWIKTLPYAGELICTNK